MLIKWRRKGAAHYCLSVFLLLGFLASIPRAAFNYPYLPRRTGLFAGAAETNKESYLTCLDALLKI